MLARPARAQLSHLSSQSLTHFKAALSPGLSAPLTDPATPILAPRPAAARTPFYDPLRDRDSPSASLHQQQPSNKEEEYLQSHPLHRLIASSSSLPHHISSRSLSIVVERSVAMPPQKELAQQLAARWPPREQLWAHTLRQAFTNSGWNFMAKSAATETPAEAAAESVEAEVEGWAGLAASLRKVLVHLGPWSAGDLAFGMRVLAERHDQDGHIDDIRGTPLTCRATVQGLLEDIEIADAAYENNVEGICNACILRVHHVVKHQPVADTLRPAYFIAVRPESRQVVLTVRGTKSLYDALTDLAGAAQPFRGGHAHIGMLAAARWLKTNESETLARLLKQHPRYTLHLVGHSMGGGTAALLAMLLKGDEACAGPLRTASLTALAVACPPIVSLELAEACRDYVTSIVCQHDIISRASLAAFEELRKEVADTKWEEVLRERLGADKVAKLAQDTSASIAETWQRASALVAKSEVSKAAGLLVQRVAEDVRPHAESAQGLLSSATDKLKQLAAQARKATDNGNGQDANAAAGTPKGNGKAVELTARAGEPSTSGSATAAAPASSGEPVSSTTEKKHPAEGSASGADGVANNEMESGEALDDGGRQESVGNAEAGAGEGGSSAAENLGNGSEKGAAEAEASASGGEVSPSKTSEAAAVAKTEQKAEAAKYSPAPHLYAPGRLLFIHRESDAEDAHFEVIDGAPGERFDRIVLRSSMIQDHLCATYSSAVRALLHRLDAVPETGLGEVLGGGRENNIVALGGSVQTAGEPARECCQKL